MSNQRRFWPGESEGTGVAEAGSAGKVLLLILGIIVLLGIAVVALWRPVIQPLVGDALPERVLTATKYEVPRDDAQVSVTVPADWTVQRAIYNPQQALIRSPDFSTEVTIDTWQHGASPSLKSAIAEATDGWGQRTDPRVERLTETLVAVSVVGSEHPDGPERLTVVVGNGINEDARSAAVFSVTTEAESLDVILPAIAELLAGVEVHE